MPKPSTAGYEIQYEDSDGYANLKDIYTTKKPNSKPKKSKNYHHYHLETTHPTPTESSEILKGNSDTNVEYKELYPSKIHSTKPKKYKNFNYFYSSAATPTTDGFDDAINVDDVKKIFSTKSPFTKTYSYTETVYPAPTTSNEFDGETYKQIAATPTTTKSKKYRDFNQYYSQTIASQSTPTVANHIYDNDFSEPLSVTPSVSSVSSVQHTAHQLNYEPESKPNSVHDLIELARPQSPNAYKSIVHIAHKPKQTVHYVPHTQYETVDSPATQGEHETTELFTPNSEVSHTDSEYFKSTNAPTYVRINSGHNLQSITQTNRRPKTRLVGNPIVQTSSQSNFNTASPPLVHTYSHQSIQNHPSIQQTLSISQPTHESIGHSISPQISNLNGQYPYNSIDASSFDSYPSPINNVSYESLSKDSTPFKYQKAVLRYNPDTNEMSLILPNSYSYFSSNPDPKHSDVKVIPIEMPDSEPSVTHQNVISSTTSEPVHSLNYYKYNPVNVNEINQMPQLSYRVRENPNAPIQIDATSSIGINLPPIRYNTPELKFNQQNSPSFTSYSTSTDHQTNGHSYGNIHTNTKPASSVPNYPTSKYEIPKVATPNSKYPHKIGNLIGHYKPTTNEVFLDLPNWHPLFRDAIQNELDLKEPQQYPPQKTQQTAQSIQYPDHVTDTNQYTDNLSEPTYETSHSSKDSSELQLNTVEILVPPLEHSKHYFNHSDPSGNTFAIHPANQANSIYPKEVIHVPPQYPNETHGTYTVSNGTKKDNNKYFRHNSFFEIIRKTAQNLKASLFGRKKR